MATEGGNGDGAGASNPLPGGVTPEMVEKLRNDFNVDAEKAPDLANYINQIFQVHVQNTAASIEKRIEEERRKKKEERKRKASLPLEQLSPVAREKALKKKQKEELAAVRKAEKEREERRKTMPQLDLTQGGIPLDSSYFQFQTVYQQVAKANFKVWEFWATKPDGKPRSVEEQNRVVEQVRDRFSNGARIDRTLIKDKIRICMNDRRNHQREYIRAYLQKEEVLLLTAEEIVTAGPPSDGKIHPEAWEKWIKEEISMKFWMKCQGYEIEQARLKTEAELNPDIDHGEKLLSVGTKITFYRRLLQQHGMPPKTLINGWHRAQKRGKKATHHLGQGGGRRFRAEFVHTLLLSPPPKLASLLRSSMLGKAKWK